MRETLNLLTDADNLNIAMKRRKKLFMIFNKKKLGPTKLSLGAGPKKFFVGGPQIYTDN